MALCWGTAMAADTTQNDLNGIVKWGVWHEGCRIYTADNAVSAADQLRECLVSVYAQNTFAQQRLRSASKDTLASAVRVAAKDVPAERQVDRFFEYACSSMGMLDSFQELERVGDFEGIRALFFQTFKAQPEIRNLLAAVSNKELGTLIQEFDLSARVRAQQAPASSPAHVPRTDSD